MQPQPDFIIGGAMKAGTTSVHQTLNLHPQIAIAPPELFFYDVDDFEQHPDFFFTDKNGNVVPTWEKYASAYISWYTRHFLDAADDVLIGEDTTSYLASRKAAKRIARHNPSAKLLFVLRDPVDRTVSHYWHMVRQGQVSVDLATAVRFGPRLLLQRSYYKPQLRRYYDHFPKRQIHVVIFEELIESTAAVLSDLLVFLNVESEGTELPLAHANPGLYPISTRLQWVLNRMLCLGPLQGSLMLGTEFPHLVELSNDNGSSQYSVKRVLGLLFRGLSRLNCQRRRRHSVRGSTRSILGRHLWEINDGISDLLQKDLAPYWESMVEGRE